MTKPSDTTWIDQLIAVGKDFGLDIPGQPPPPARTRTTSPVPPAEPPPAAQTTVPPATLVAVSHEVSRTELADLLQTLATRLRGGSIVLQPGPYAVQLEVPGEVSIDIAARTAEEGEHTELAVDLTIRWSADHESDSLRVFGAATETERS